MEALIDGKAYVSEVPRRSPINVRIALLLELPSFTA
jgi:hypothetical protein